MIGRRADRPDGADVGVIEYVLQRKAVDVADARRYMFTRVSTTAWLNVMFDVMLSTVTPREDGGEDDDERADADMAVDVLFVPRAVRGAAGRVGTFYGALLTTEKVIKLMEANERQREAQDEQKVNESAVRAAANAAEQPVTAMLRRLGFIEESDAAVARATVAQLTAFCSANAGLVMTVNGGKIVPTGNSMLRADKVAIAQSVAAKYAAFAVQAGEAGGRSRWAASVCAACRTGSQHATATADCAALCPTVARGGAAAACRRCAAAAAVRAAQSRARTPHTTRPAPLPRRARCASQRARRCASTSAKRARARRRRRPRNAWPARR